jgi:hypothetical protein
MTSAEEALADTDARMFGGPHEFRPAEGVSGVNPGVGAT